MIEHTVQYVYSILELLLYLFIIYYKWLLLITFFISLLYYILQ